MIYKVTRDITPKECPWLDKTIVTGTIVHEYNGYTYGCIAPEGIAVTTVKDETPFFEVPFAALDSVNESTSKIK